MGVSILLQAGSVSSLGGLVFGYELAIISGALLQVRAEFNLSCVQQEVVVSSLLIGALLASSVGGFLIDRRGRRTAILLSNVLILAGSLVLLMGSFPALVLGRALVGFAMCVSSMSCCILVSELVTPERRGVLVTLYEAGITLGILTAYAVNYFLSESRGGWKWMFGLAVAPTLIQLASIWFLPSSSRKEPPSQRYRDLMSKTENRDDDDLKIVETDKYDILFLFRRRDNMRTRTVIGLGLVLFQQFTGQPTVLLYASTVFRSVGFRSDSSAVLASVGLGLVKVVVTLTSMLFSDRIGRRPLLIGGCSLMAVCLVTIGLLSGRSSMDAQTPCSSGGLTPNRTDLGANATFRILQNDTHLEELVGQKIPNIQPSPSGNGTVTNWIILVCMMGVVSAYSFGFGPMTWLLLSEIFPAAIRGRAFAFTNCFNWAANLLVTFTFLNCIDAMGLSGMFVLYGVTAVAAGLFFYIVLPETKGKSLEEIDKELRLNKFYHGCFRNASPQYQRVHCEESGSG